MKKLIVFTLFLMTSVSYLSAQQTPVNTLVTAFITNDSTSFKDYCGIYKMVDNPYVEEVKIEFKNGRLVSRTPDDEEIEFQHTENDEFFIPPFNATAIFIRENGQVKGVKVKVQGKELIGEKR